MTFGRKPVKDFLFFFFAQCLSYGLIAWNTRAIAQAWYGSIVVSDMLYAGYNFIMIKKVVDEKSKAGFAGYVLGGACGTLISVYLTKRIFGS
jgi:hypothetical protein